jgi:ATP synthase protein I
VTTPEPTAPEPAPRPEKDEPHVATVLRLAGAMQRYAAIITAVVAVIALVVAFLMRDVPGLIGALVGAVIGAALGWLGTWVMARTARASPAGVMIGAMTAFGVKIVVMLVFLLLFQGTTLFDNRAFAFTLLAVTAAWIVGEVVGFVRTRIPAVDI